MTARDAIWFVAGLLCAGALLVLVLPWVRRQPQSVADGRPVPRYLWMAAPLLLVVAAGLYAWLGSPTGAWHATLPGRAGASAAATGTGSASGSAGTMTQAVAGLEARLAQGGGTDADWNLLAQSYEFLGRTADVQAARQHHLPAGAGGASAAGAAPTPSMAPLALSPAARQLLAQAEQARRKRDFSSALGLYARLAQMQQMNADAWADYADAQASADGKLATPATAGYIEQALRLEPAHVKALWLKASLQEETAQFAAAAQTFQALLAQLPPASSDATLVRDKIAEDLKLAPAAVAAAAPKPTASPAAARGPRLSGEIVLDPALTQRVRPGMTLFVLAKAVGEGGPPVAVYKTVTGSWPVKFELTDANAMMPGRDLSSARQVVVEARISASGQALAQPGDLQGSSVPLAPAGSKPLRIVIQKVVG